MSKIAAIPNQGRNIKWYTKAAAASFNEGAAVLLTAGELDECGADPAVILGFALSSSAVELPDPDRTPVAIADSKATFWLEGSSAPVAADEGVEYGLAVDGDGDWYVDKTEAVNTRVVVESVDLTRNLFEVRVLPANRQLD